ncbi:hypothetical protein LJC42_04990 [Eubacteriales bacterium OttesenSCG-928-K08]|nr:hypothetical protein [Eubacteriales bacterium OttesenSCG-928-K08]
MDGLFIIVAIFAIIGRIVGNANNKKKREEAAKKAEAARASQAARAQRNVQGASSVYGKQSDPRFPDYSPATPVIPAQPNYTEAGDAARAAAQQERERELQRRRELLEQSRLERIAREERARQEAEKAMRGSLCVDGHEHELEGPRFEDTVRGRETIKGMRQSQSMADKAAQPIEAATLANITKDRNALKQAIILSEILGKPKALQR